MPCCPLTHACRAGQNPASCPAGGNPSPKRLPSTAERRVLLQALHLLVYTLNLEESQPFLDQPGTYFRGCTDIICDTFHEHHPSWGQVGLKGMCMLCATVQRARWLALALPRDRGTVAACGAQRSTAGFQAISCAVAH